MKNLQPNFSIVLSPSVASVGPQSITLVWPVKRLWSSILDIGVSIAHVDGNKREVQIEIHIVAPC